ncbi:hypothetical protein MMC30_006011 [Trapelia coarctata]|nr:hypothetical protein [Trapelia coarctata]
MPPLPPTAVPTRTIFDPYNSSATGHQTHASRLSGSTSWRASRSLKLSAQLSAGVAGGGGRRVADTVGAGSEDWGRDGRKENGEWDTSSVVGARAKAGVGRGVGDVGMMLGGTVRKGEGGKIKEEGEERERAGKRVKVEGCEDRGVGEVEGGEEAFCPLPSQAAIPKSLDAKGSQPAKRPIFASLTFYINGSTAPLVSDHRLKYLIVEHGGALSVGLGRRSVTHVILGQENRGGGKGAGGGLAGGKIQKEIKRVGGCGVKYVSVEWVLESLKAGKRLAEAGVAGVSTAPAGVKSVYGMFKKGEGGKGTK